MSIIYYVIQVVVLAPLALLLVLEAHFVIAHFINIVCCGVVHISITAPTQHIYIHDDKLVTKM